MIDRIRTSWRVGMSSWDVLFANPLLMVFPIISGVVLLLLVAVTGGTTWVFFPGVFKDLIALVEDQDVGVAGIALLFSVYFAGYLIVIFFNSALVGATEVVFDGGEPTIQEGLRLAASRWRAILGYTAIAATIGLLLSALRRRGGFLEQFVASISDLAWGLVTFFVVPMLVIRGVGPIQAIRESARLFRRTWGESVAGNIGLSIVGFALLLPAIALGMLLIPLAAALDSLVLYVIAFGGIAFLVGLSIVATSALSSVFRVALYRYATGEGVVAPFQEDWMRNTFKSKSPDRRYIDRPSYF